MILQTPGFLIGASICGVHSGGNSFEAVIMVVNGVIYTPNNWVGKQLECLAE
jgi:hypothetical protein